MPAPQGLMLAIETSCDDTAAAVLRGPQVLSNVVNSQPEHAQYGGILPELASRRHHALIWPTIRQALDDAGLDLPSLDALDAIAYTQGPGLMGSLLVGGHVAQGLAQALNKPLLGVDHLMGHRVSVQLGRTETAFPCLSLIVSGGHTQLVHSLSPLVHRVVGQTRDDAAGEAFDKGAKLLGLGYPGGPVVDRLAQQGNPQHVAFPMPRLPDFAFSFSGLKTAVLYHLQAQLATNPTYLQHHQADLCASLQQAIVGQLLYQLEAAATSLQVPRLGLAGGVAANSALRTGVQHLADRLGMEALLVDRAYCTDNAAMIGLAGQYLWAARATTPLGTPSYAEARG